MSRCLWTIALLVALPAARAQSTDTTHTLSPAKTRALIASALSAAPHRIAAHATVMAPGPDGKMIVLRRGTNGFTCTPDDPSTPGPDPVCMDEQAMKWTESYSAHAAKPANTSPGVMYMLAGGSDASNTDPYATTSTHWITSGPHWMLMWAFDSTSGFSTVPSTKGTYIMWAGTPWAHLMINQAP
ncbi:MAG TPA: hypothetical protein VNW46_11740 [Gemmatimonadaceae bacterium]|jgi:hypothetical protein|nr:hypothetical protein [Gemmatimonadaceae bacterium]